MKKIYILDAKRSPMGSFMGELNSKTAVELGTDVVKSITQPVKNAAAIHEIVMGCVLPAGLGQAPARQVAVRAGLSKHIHASTINKVCGSGLKAVMMVADSVHLGRIDLGIAGGMESMSNAPYLLPKVRQGYKYGHTQLLDHMALDGLEDAYEGVSMGILAERLAEGYAFSREAQDDYAAASTQKAQKAMETGAFVAEITPITLDGKAPYVMDRDEGPRKAKPEKIPNLRPAFKKDGSITAANASPISDGAAALLLGSEDSLSRHPELKPRAIIHAYASYSHDPEWFTTAPINAIQTVLNETGWSVNDVDLFEINEAFAVVPMAAMRDLNIPTEKVNIHGGALVLGHPLGASGARVVVTLLHALEHHNFKKGVAALCVGGGEGVAIAIELL